MGKWIIYTDSRKIIYRIKVSPDQFHNQIILHKITNCVWPSAIFSTPYPHFYSAAFRQTTNTEHTISFLFLFFCPIVRWRNISVSVRMWCSVRRSWIAANNLFRLFEGPIKAFESSQLVSDLVNCFVLFSELPQQIFVRRTRHFLHSSISRIWLLD